MTTRTKIIVVILMIIAIVVLGFGIYKSVNKKEDDGKKNQLGSVVDYYSEITTPTTTEEDTSSTTTESTTTNTTNTTTQSSSSVEGKEEKESAGQTNESEKQTAIELAQKEWGLSTTAYSFEIVKEAGNGVYEVSIRNKSDTREVERYTVNVRTGSVVNTNK